MTDKPPLYAAWRWADTTATLYLYNDAELTDFVGLVKPVARPHAYDPGIPDRYDPNPQVIVNAQRRDIIWSKRYAGVPDDSVEAMPPELRARYDEAQANLQDGTAVSDSLPRVILENWRHEVLYRRPHPKFTRETT